MDTLRNQQLVNMNMGSTGYNQNNWMNAPARNSYTGMSPNQSLPRYSIVRVTGENGARAMQMAPDSQLIAVDETKSDRLWLLQTDGAGYLTVRPIKAEFEDIVTQQTIQETLMSISDRLTRLEEKLNDEQLNSRSSKQRSGRSSNTESAEP